jgi:hypothetical protein
MSSQAAGLRAERIFPAGERRLAPLHAVDWHQPLTDFAIGILSGFK